MAKIIVWKSDFKDFKGLWYACYYYKDHIVRRTKNFLEFEDVNPYELLRYPYIQREANEFSYNDFLECLQRITKEDLLLKEYDLLLTIRERVDNLEVAVDIERICSLLHDALVYPKGHVTRLEIFQSLAKNEPDNKLSILAIIGIIGVMYSISKMKRP